MNVVLVKEEELAGGRVILRDHRAQHIVKVLKAAIGDTIRMGIIGGRLGSGRIVGLARKYPFQVEVQAVFDTSPPPKNPIDMVLALPRPIMLRRIFSQVAALGVETIHIINAARVEKSFWEAGLVDLREYRPFLLQGLEQAVDTVAPQVLFHRGFKAFIENILPPLTQRYSYMLYAHPGGAKRLAEIITCPGRVLLAIGPEGGWVDYETERFEESGFQGFSIGQRILKVDTAVINIHGRLMAELERSAGGQACR